MAYTKERLLAGKWLNRLRFKTTWKEYNEGNISYFLYVEKCQYLVLNIRKILDLEPFTAKQYNEAWYYLFMSHEDYIIAYHSMIAYIFGNW